MKLYSYWRSSAAYRVRIALNLKGLDYQYQAVHLVKDGGEQHSEDYKMLNPHELVPTLVDGDLVLNQSLAIIQYLDDKYPAQPLLPVEAQQKAIAYALALDIACEVHPLNNLRVQQYLSGELALDGEQKQAWLDHWMSTGFAGVETRLKNTHGLYCVGDQVSLADICLIPQVYNAKRFGIELKSFPTIQAIYSNCMALPAFIQASPEKQIDAQ